MSSANAAALSAVRWKGGAARAFGLLGPAVIISVGYMDPGNWATDLAGGSQFGYSLLWVLLVSNLIALLLQHLSAKLGIATGQTYPEVCRRAFPRWVSATLWMTAELAAVATDFAEFIGAALGIYLLFRVPLLPAALITTVLVIAILSLYRFGFRAVEFAIFSLVATVAMAYVVEVWLVGPDWSATVHGVFRPVIEPGALPIAMGMLGATVMPHNLYLHSSVILPYRRSSVAQNQRTIRSALIASALALNVAWLVNSAIVVTSAGTFGDAGMVVDSIEQAHQTLAPLLGPAAAAAFAIALFAAGISSSTTATLAGQVIIEGFLNVRFSLLLRRLITLGPALIAVAFGIDAFSLLVISQIALSIQLPFAILPLVLLTARPSVMGPFANHRFTTAVALLAGIAVVALNGVLLTTLVVGV